MEEIPQRRGCRTAETVETLTGRVEQLTRQVSRAERRHEDDMRRLWMRIAVLTVITAALTGDGRIIAWVLGVMG